MLIGDVMDDLSDALKVLPGINVYPYWAQKVVTPAVIIAWPNDYRFDGTMQRGMDQFVLPVIVLVGRAESSDSKDRMSVYASGSGSGSVKQILEAATHSSCDSVRVQSVEFSVMNIAGADYLAGTFNVHVVGKGA